MNKFISVLLLAFLFGCSQPPKKQSYLEIQKNKIDSICVRYDAVDFNKLSSDLILLNLNTWSVQSDSKNRVYVFEIDFFTSIVSNKDSLYLMYKNINTVVDIDIPKDFKSFPKDGFVVFRINSCDAFRDCEDVKFSIKGSIVDIIAD